MPNFVQTETANFLPELASNHDPSAVHLQSNYDYRCEPPGLVQHIIFKK
jgi:hypothetical protein